LGGEWVIKIFDIFIAYVSWGDGGKKRPVLIIENHETVVLVFNITTQYRNKSKTISSKYFKIIDWAQAGLAEQSYVDTNIVRDLPLRVLDGKTAIGRLTRKDKRRLLEFLNNNPH
jgi:hypothetical protein